MFHRQLGEGSPDNLQDFVKELTANQGRIRAFIVSLMPGSPDVGDVLQETNIVLWKGRARFRPGTSFIAWALTLARLEVLHHRTRAKRRKITLLSDELLELVANEQPVDSEPHEYYSALDSCKKKLTSEQRELIDRRYSPNYSLKDYASEVGKKPSALRVALMRVRESLRVCIERTLKETQT